MITFTEERLDQKSLRFSVESYKFLKERYIQKIRAMVDYASQTAICRSRYLLDYFGEKDPPRCDQCDVCRDHGEQDLSRYEFDTILGEIRTNLAANPMKITDLSGLIRQPEEKFTRVFRWLLDHGKIVRTSDNAFVWNEN